MKNRSFFKIAENLILSTNLKKLQTNFLPWSVRTTRYNESITNFFRQFFLNAKTENKNLHLPLYLENFHVGLLFANR